MEIKIKLKQSNGEYIWFYYLSLWSFLKGIVKYIYYYKIKIK